MGHSPKELLLLGDTLFSKKEPLHQLWDELALNFYPERANFQQESQIGNEFASHLMDSFPVQARAELSSTLSAMLRPSNQVWFNMTTLDNKLDKVPEVAQWMETQSQLMRRLMYFPQARFVRATREGDNDYVTFGQCVLSVEEAPNRDHLLYRGWHLKDNAWLENDIGEIDHNHRNMKMTVRSMVQRWGKDKLDPTMQAIADKEPSREFKIRHVCLPSEEYKSKTKLPFVSVYIDVENQHVLSDSGVPDFMYIIPRWATVSGSVYAHSPSAMIALPDARFAQTMSQILIEAGEKAVDPPALATEESIRSDIDLMSGGITWLDNQYDERLGPPLRFLESKGNFELGLEFKQDVRQMIARTFFLDKLDLPLQDRMTATEVIERIKQFVRGAIPLFEPMETDYNPQILNKTFGIVKNANLIDVDSMPDELSGVEFQFSFQSPIQEAEGRANVAQYAEVTQLTAAGAEKGVTSPVNEDEALKDAVRGTGMPASWLLTDEEIAEQKEVDEEGQNLASAAEIAREGAGVASDVAGASLDLQEAGLA